VKFHNLTPHAIVVRTPSGDRTFPPTGLVARVETEEYTIGEVDGIPLVGRTAGRLILPNVPGAESNDQLIVSSMALDAASVVQARRLVAPDTGTTAVRNDKGHVVAVTRLVGRDEPAPSDERE